MSHAIIFDTLKYATKLKEAGTDSKIAEAQASVMGEAISELIDNQLITKNEMKSLLVEFEIKMQAYFFKIVMSAVVFLGGLQTLFHFVK